MNLKQPDSNRESSEALRVNYLAKSYGERCMKDFPISANGGGEKRIKSFTIFANAGFDTSDEERIASWADALEAELLAEDGPRGEHEVRGHRVSLTCDRSLMARSWGGASGKTP
jgi:hypothetical protein